MLTAADAQAFERCVADGGVALFPADTVYGLACDPESSAAVQRLYELKGRPADKPSAVMFFALDGALEALPELGPRTRAALGRLLPGAITLLVPNPQRRFALACGPEPETLGVRVPVSTALRTVSRPVLQSSANRAGLADPASIDAVVPELRRGADLVLDGGQLPGVSSTVLDLREYEGAGRWLVLREGAVPARWLGEALG